MESPDLHPNDPGDDDDGRLGQGEQVPPRPHDHDEDDDDFEPVDADEDGEPPVPRDDTPLERPQYLCEAIRMRDGQIPDLADDNYMELVHPYTHYYCENTLDAMGPDDLPACPEECTPERECFKLSIHSPQR